jgi:sugar phosphate permease
MGAGAIITGLVTIGLPFVSTSYPLVIIFRIIAGAGQGMFFTGNAHMVSKWFPKSEISRAYRFLRFYLHHCLPLFVLERQ